MKYHYTIFADGDFDEDALIKALASIGLEEIFVEKFYNVNAILADQNKFNDENFYSKWERVKEAKIFPSDEFIRRTEERFDAQKEKSMYLLFDSVMNAGIECDIPNYTIGKIMYAMAELLQE